VYLTEEQMTYFFAGAALMSVLFGLTAIFAPRVCGGKDSWLAEVLKGDTPFSWGLCWLQLGAAVALVGAVIAAPVTYYRVCELEQQAELHRVEQRVTEEALKSGYEQSSSANGLKLWRKSPAP
jgi:hypothetical protein